MKSVLGAFCFVLLLASCSSRSALDDEEESVVSIYTTVPSTKSGRPLDVYQQIATNLAQKITNPIYRFLGFGGNKTEESRSYKSKTWNKIEIVDDNPEEVTKSVLDPIDNNISDRDVEELSVEALKKLDRKPEKITLYSSYLPAKLEINDTLNEVDGSSDGFDDEPFDFDDVITSNDEAKQPRIEGTFISFLEFIGNWIQLIWGGLSAYFAPAPPIPENRSR